MRDGQVKQKGESPWGWKGDSWIAHGCWATPQGRWATDLGKSVLHAQIFNILITVTYLLLLYVYIFIIAFKNEDILNS